jgi:hypothetical protein
MEKGLKNSNSTKKTAVKNEVESTLLSVAAKLNGKKLFTKKVERTKNFFNSLDTAHA